MNATSPHVTEVVFDPFVTICVSVNTRKAGGFNVTFRDNQDCYLDTALIGYTTVELAIAAGRRHLSRTETGGQWDGTSGLTFDGEVSYS